MDNATEPHGLATLTEAGKAPKERLDSGNKRRELAANLIRNDRQRNKQDARIKGMIDGNPPYDTTKLKKHAQSWRDNTNYLEGKAAHSAAMVPYYDLLSGASAYANVRLKLEDPTVSLNKSQIASEEWDRMLRDDESFEFHLMLAMNDRLRYGKGFLTWSEEWEPMPHWVNRFQVHVPDRQLAYVDELEVLVVEEDFYVDRLWRMINSSKASDAGWNVEETKKAIRRAQPIEKDYTYRQDLTQAKWSDKDILEGQSSAKVNAAHVFVREFGGKVSHYIVELEGAAASVGPTAKGKPEGDLFARPNRYANWYQAFWATFHELGDGSWNGTSGLGKDIIKHIEIKNRLKCSATDLAFLRSSINLRATSDASFGKVAVVQQGPITVYPPGYEHLNVASFVGDIESVLALDESIYRTIGRNTGIYQQVPDKEQGNPLTATGEMIRQQHSAVLTNSSVQRFYRDLDRLYREMWRRTVNAPESLRTERVSEFLERCTSRGVVLNDLKRWDYVRAQRNSGNGSVVMRQQNLAQLASLVPMFPPKGQEEWVRDSVSALTNFDTAARYSPRLEAGEDITHHHQIAQLESGNLVDGKPVIYSPEDNHVVHAQNHMQNATGAFQSLQSGGDPVQVLAALDMLMPHANMHIVALEGNPARQNEGKMLRQQWVEVAKLTDDLRKKVQQMQQQQGQAQQAAMKAQMISMMQDPEIQLKAAEMKADLALRKQRQDALLAMRADKQRQEMALADAQTASQIKLNAAKTASEIRQSSVKTVSDVRQSEVKAAAKNRESGEKPEAPAKKADLPTINIALKADGAVDVKKPKTVKKVKFNRDTRGKLVSGEIEETTEE